MRDRAIWWQAIDGGAPQRLTSPGDDEEHIPESWSADGKHLLFSVRKPMVYSLWVLTLADMRTAPFAQVWSAQPLSAGFSPDGRWVVYASSETDGGAVSPDRGVFIDRFPWRPGAKRQAPKRLLDYHPRGAPGGKSIFYVPGANQPIVSVPVDTQSANPFGAVVELTLAPMPGLLGSDFRGYDVLPDGRIVSISSVSGDGLGSPSEVRIVLNWQEELKRLVPTR
jgi:hypothetical protein